MNSVIRCSQKAIARAIVMRMETANKMDVIVMKVGDLTTVPSDKWYENEFH